MVRTLQISMKSTQRVLNRISYYQYTKQQVAIQSPAVFGIYYQKNQIICLCLNNLL